MQRQIVHVSPIAVRDSLEKVGVAREILVKAAQRGFAERALSHPCDPKTAPGTDAWRYSVRSLRDDLLGEENWRQDDPKNLPLIINDALGVNITVSSGDEMTGVYPGTPKTRNPKGALLEEAVKRNVLQGEMFPETLPVSVTKYEKTVSNKTWIFLIYITDEEIRAELSLPNSYGENDHLDGWAERIIIDVPLPDEEQYSSDDRDQGPNIEPEISSKI